MMTDLSDSNLLLLRGIHNAVSHLSLEVNQGLAMTMAAPCEEKDLHEGFTLIGRAACGLLTLCDILEPFKGLPPLPIVNARGDYDGLLPEKNTGGPGKPIMVPRGSQHPMDDAESGMDLDEARGASHVDITRELGEGKVFSSSPQVPLGPDDPDLDEDEEGEGEEGDEELTEV